MPRNEDRATVLAYLERCDQALAAQLLGCNARTVRTRIEGGLYRALDGRVDVFHALQSDRERAKAKAGPSAADANNRLVIAKARIAELDADARAGELVPVDDVAEALADVASTFSAMLAGTGARLAAQLVPMTDPSEIQAAIDDELRRIRTETADRLLEHGVSRRDRDGGGDREATPAPDAGPVGGSVPDSAEGERRAGAVAQ